MKATTTLVFLLTIIFTSAAQNPKSSVEDLFSIPKSIDKSKFIQSIRVTAPQLRSDVNGKVTVQFTAQGMDRAAAKCYCYTTDKKGETIGTNKILTPKGIKLDAQGRGSFVFNANKLQVGPISIHIYADNSKGERDIFELQLYNTSENEKGQHAGIPDTLPSAAKGLRLAFSDDFRTPLSITRDGRNARYNAHKPNFGDFSGWPFTDPEGVNSPFEQRDEYLIIHARKPEGTKGSTGLLASVNMDGEGFWAKAPFYMECRFTAQSAPGTWPAFWTITNPERGAGDELDIIEAYGGWGNEAPNFKGYIVTSHFWEQYDKSGKELYAPNKTIAMEQLGAQTSWSEAFHTYGVHVDENWTTYYLDDQEVYKHQSNRLSYTMPHLFLINYAIGGASGWKIDLERYGNASDMYVDYVRVYTK